VAEFKSLEDAMLDLHAPGRIEFVERKDPIVTGPPLGIPVLTPETPSVVWALRRHQENDAILGPLFHDLHVFADRTISEFYKDTPSLPHPVVAEALEWPLPGRPEPTKKLAKYQCPSCEVRIRHRRKDLALACLDCETALVRVG
jgi:hypothetical protein